MCQFKSAIVLKNRVFVPDHDHHSDMLEDLGIDDDYVHASKVFVRVELSPTDGDKTSDVYGWKLKVDQDITPDWWDEKVDAQRVKDAIKEWCDVHILRSGNHVVKGGVWYAYNNATVKAYGNATVKASGNATVEAYDNATVEAYGNATVTAYDNATVTAYGNATVEAYNNATVKAYDNATVTAYNNATVEAYGNATVTAYDNATVILPKLYQTYNHVELHGEAICVNHRTKVVETAVEWRFENA